MNRLSIVVPCYNEEQVIYETTKRLSSIISKLIEENLISKDSYILYVDDGCIDNTWSIITELNKSNKYVRAIKLSHNSGHQSALIAGLSIAVLDSDIFITIDADLQDDVNKIRDMVLMYIAGNDIVYGVRKNRKSDTFFKRFTAESFYKTMQYLGVKTIFNHADYRLMSKRAVNCLLKFKERNLFIRGIVPLIGYNSTCVYYDRTERFAGESKYPLKKMLSFAFDGITSFSIKPVHLLLYIGVIFLFISFIILIWVLYSLFKGDTVSGWTSIILSIWFVGGILLIGLGIVGEYIGKIYIEVKERPRYNIEEQLEINNDK